ncbi:hypothetical protein [Thiohalophilus sp.]|uniref:hypothetical protein n=1 Tax=Thiohalophilus sp. TaxID=3028392 RepID=UPI002ACD501A|nr:hypothetical protein [Thiohalophilus sp.]MDZ7662534.1 hypothetical protein [Thiohalophilus sp.]
MYISVQSVNSDEYHARESKGKIMESEGQIRTCSIVNGNLELTVESESGILYASQTNYYRTGTVRLTAAELCNLIGVAFENGLLSIVPSK